MNPIGRNFTALAGAAVIAAVLSACGGGDAGAPYAPTASTGYAVDGYLKDASVTCDASGVVVKTDSSGFFRFPDGCSSAVTLTGGINVDTLLPFIGTLKAPAGSKMVTPLTTLLVGGMTQVQVNASLGLLEGTDLTNTDPALTSAGTLVNPNLLKTTLAVQQFAQKLTETFAELAASGGDAAKPKIYSEVAVAMAQALTANQAFVSRGVISESVATAVCKAAVERVKAATTLPAAVIQGVSGLNSDSLAQVIAAALKFQGDAILDASNAAITSTTKTQQQSTAIGTFVRTNRANLTGAPSASTANLASNLRDAVAGVTPPSSSGTVLLNFDNLQPTAANGYEGGEDSAVDAAPPSGGGTTGSVYKVLRSGGQPYALAVLVTTLPLTTTQKIISARVYSPTAGIPMVIKLENATDAGINTGDVQANETVVAGWQTLTWTFGTAGTANYGKIILLPNLGTVDAAPGKSYYFDDFTLAPVANAGGGSGTGAITFSSGFAANALTKDGGAYGAFSGSNLDNWQCNGAPENCGTGGNFSGDAGSSLYHYYQTTTPATGLYAGVYVMAPGVTRLSDTGNTLGMTINGQTKMNFTFNQNQEWFNSATKNFFVIFELGKRYVVGDNATCRLQLRKVITPTSINATAYSVNFSEMSVVQNCGASIHTPVAALADGPISQVSFQAAGGSAAVSDGTLTSGANLSVSNGTVYPTTVAVTGTITFD